MKTANVTINNEKTFTVEFNFVQGAKSPDYKTDLENYNLYLNHEITINRAICRIAGTENDKTNTITKKDGTIVTVTIND